MLSPTVVDIQRAMTVNSAIDYSTQLRHQYLGWARQVLQKPELDYNSLYRQFADNEWACEQLDLKVATLALKNQGTPTQAAYLMAQSPHAQYEINERGTAPEALLPYAKAIVSQCLAQIRSPQALWNHYSQGVEAKVPAQRTQATIRNALRDGQSHEAIAVLLKADPEYQRLEASMGETKAKQYAQLALSAAVRGVKAEKQPSRTRQLQVDQKSDLGLE